MGIFDSMLVKYGATIVGYAILAMPVFGPESSKYIKADGKLDTASITKMNTINSGLLINMSKVSSLS